MKRLTIMTMVAAWAMTMTAQTAREEIEANKYVAASNYLLHLRAMCLSICRTTDAMARVGLSAKTATPVLWNPCRRPDNMAN